MWLILKLHRVIFRKFSSILRSPRLKSQMPKQILAIQILVAFNFCLQMGGESCHTLPLCSVHLPDSLLPPKLLLLSFSSSLRNLLILLLLPCCLFSITHMEAFLTLPSSSPFHSAVFTVDFISCLTLSSCSVSALHSGPSATLLSSLTFLTYPYPYPHLLSCPSFPPAATPALFLASLPSTSFLTELLLEENITMAV